MHITKPNQVDFSSLSNKEVESFLTGMISDVTGRGDGKDLATKEDMMILQGVIQDVTRRIVEAGDAEGARRFMKEIKDCFNGGEKKDGEL